jgi:hypothetical protein
MSAWVTLGSTGAQGWSHVPPPDAGSQEDDGYAGKDTTDDGSDGCRSPERETTTVG